EVEMDATLKSLRAIALIHLDRMPEALAIDSALARFTAADRAYGQFARAGIAAHLGENERAVALLKQALASGFHLSIYSTGFWRDPTLLPLSGDGAFVALLKSGA